MTHILLMSLDGHDLSGQSPELLHRYPQRLHKYAGSVPLH